MLAPGPPAIASTAPLRISLPSTSTPLIRVCAVNGMNSRRVSISSRSRDAVPLLRQHHDRAPSGVSSASEASCATSASSARRRPARDERHGLAVAERDRPGLVQEQDGDVARRLDRPPAHRQDVALHQPVHPRDPDRREQAADRRRDQADEQRDQDRVADAAPRRRCANGCRATQTIRKMIVNFDQQDQQRDLVGRLLTLGALDQGDHAVQERLARDPR